MTWTTKANLRGPAGVNATDAAQDAQALANFAAAPAGANPFAAALLARFSRRGEAVPDMHRIVIDPALAYAPRAARMTVPTYEGSNTAVHPSVYFNPAGWNGFEYWMAMTPYPAGNSALENPSILCSHDGDTWTVPAGVVNPLDPDPGNGAYNSDPSLVVGNDGIMYMFWRTVGVPSGAETIYYRTSKDGVTWTPKVSLYSAPQAGRRLLAPSMIQLGSGEWIMYAVDIVPTPYRLVRIKAATLADFQGMVPELCTFTGAWSGVQPWHIDAHRIGGEYHMLVQDSGSGGGDLFAAVSADGLTFKAGPKFIPRGAAGEWDSKYYKSCFIPAVKNGKFGWDTWVTGATFAASGTIMGRTFVAFDDQPARDAATLDRQWGIDLNAARAGIYPWLAGDGFGRPDAATLGNANTGQAWVSDTGVMKITNRAASPTTATNTRAMIDVGTADHWTTVRLDSAPTSAQHWLIVRAVDGSNYYRVGFQSGDSKLYAQTITAAAVANTLAAVTLVPAPAAGIYIGARALPGGVLEIYANGVKVATATDATHAGTKTGIQSTAATAVFRAFTTRNS